MIPDDNMVSRRRALQIGAGIGATTLAGCLSGDSEGGEYPDGTITLVVPYSEGGGTDTEARGLQAGLSDALDTNIQIENVPGAGGVLGLDETMRSDPDGYRICAILPPANGILNDILGTDDSPIDYLNDVKPVCGYSISPYIIYANPSHEIEDFNHLLDLYADGEFANVGVGSVGSAPWVQAVQMQLNETNWEFDQAVPYGGSGPTNQAVVADEVPVGIATPNSIADFVSEGELDPIVHTSSLGSETFPDIGVVEDYGHPNIDPVAQLLRGFAVPPETPDEIIEVLSNGVEEALQHEESQEFAENTGTTLNFISHEEYNELYREIVEGLPNELDIEAFQGYL